MTNNGIRDHIGSEGLNPGDRLNEACYHWQDHGEILAGSRYRSLDEVIVAWMRSPSHRYVILSDSFTEFGAAYAYNKNREFKHFYTVDFGLRYPAVSATRMDYYTCTYSLENETGAIWMNIHSVWPCDQVLNSSSGMEYRR